MLFIKPGVDGTGGRCHTPSGQVALATCPTHACHVRCDANFLIKKLLENMFFKLNFELLLI